METLQDILRHQRCYHHHGREAVVRCPECGRFYCRECVTEHDDRMLCSRCLEQITHSAAGKPGGACKPFCCCCRAWVAG